jgi:hypothetical protein
MRQRLHLPCPSRWAAHSALATQYWHQHVALANKRQLFDSTIVCDAAYGEQSRGYPQTTGKPGLGFPMARISALISLVVAQCSAIKSLPAKARARVFNAPGETCSAISMRRHPAGRCTVGDLVDHWKKRNGRAVTRMWWPSICSHYRQAWPGGSARAEAISCNGLDHLSQRR